MATKKTITKSKAQKNAEASRPDFDAILRRLCNAMSIISTATRSMTAIEQEHGSLHEPEANIGDELVTLRAGLRAFETAYDEIEIAIRAVLS